ncbi:NUDIX domain-containing protein [Tateyamaria omphalii]|uniref:NUDIX domain-containing protein n=1 Tax=Tateyamaria omphalii TaxID=299262 RepID=UPI0012F94BDD|nr:NUDIX domain-containing protein [Tateyamaria omphalii]
MQGTDMVSSVAVKKSIVFIRRGSGILVFRHPQAGVQLPKGTVEFDETPATAARREVFEEVGLALQGPLHALGTWSCPTPPALWHVFVAEAPVGTEEAWQHAPTGGGDETGLVFDVFWIDVYDARDRLHPLFLPVLDMMQQHVGSG